MTTIYSTTNKIRFSDISEKYNIPKMYKAKQIQAHSLLIQYVSDNFRNTKKYKEQVVKAVNIITFSILTSSFVSFDWKCSDPFGTLPEYDEDTLKESLGEYYLSVDSIEWDVKESERACQPDISLAAPKSTPTKLTSKPTAKAAAQRVSSTSKKEQAHSLQTTKPITLKEDLYIQCPKIPQFDYTQPWLATVDRDDELVIYKTLPEIPTKQCEISVTTDLSAMTDAELMNLYPDRIIRTRSASMYEKVDGLDFDEVLGCILPITGFSKAQVIDNIIKYPHFYKLKRYQADGTYTSFYEDIEINGELFAVSDIWDTLPESKVIPRASDFIKEYVARRYLLERDNGIHHNFELYGTLDPFLTLFMPPEEYIRRGYNNSLEIVKQCVQSRISFKQSRNPILKRLEIEVGGNR